jgi:hypothetical protein
LNSASKNGHIEVVKLLLEKGADVGVANKKWNNIIELRLAQWTWDFTLLESHACEEVQVRHSSYGILDES